MSNLPAKVVASLPAHIRAAVSAESFNELTAGVQSGFPVLSYRGKVWRVRKSGEEQNYTDADGDAVQSIELVLLRSNPQPSKIFYASAYEEGSTEAPTCWSADGVKPDPGVKTPLSKSCATCPKNEWGSKLTPTGAKTKACSDARRLAVVFAHELAEKGRDATTFLLRIPPASLNPLKDYAEKVLQPKGIPYFSVITKIGFDANVAYPKLTFKAKQFLDEEQMAVAMELRESEDVRRILAESHEFAGAGSTEGGDVAGAAEPAEDTPAPAPAPAKAKRTAPKPVEAEEVEVEEIAAPAPAKAKAKVATPAPAPVIEPETEDEEEIAAPAPAPAKAKAKRSTQPAKLVETDDDAPAAAPAASDDFESMLDSILKG